MTIKEIREVLGPKYHLVPDKTLIAIVSLIDSICQYIVSTESIQDNTECIEFDDYVL